MSVAVIKKKIRITPNNDPITIELEFETMLICTYRVEVREKNSNAVLFDRRGDNTNNEDDKYVIGAAIENVERTVWVFINIIDQTGDGGDYEIKALFKQNSNAIDDGILTTGKKNLPAGGGMADYIFVTKLIG